MSITEKLYNAHRSTEEGCPFEVEKGPSGPIFPVREVIGKESVYFYGTLYLIGKPLHTNLTLLTPVLNTSSPICLTE